MPKIPYKPEKANETNEDYEIVSFEDFCDKSPGSKADLLTLNDNINYRLCFESDKSVNYEPGEGSSGDKQSETSLGGVKNVGPGEAGSFAPFGRSTGKSRKGPLLRGVIPKSRPQEDSSSPEKKYQRFSGHSSRFSRIWEWVGGAGPGVLVIAVIVAMCIGVWWAVSGALGGSWGEEQYRKLWEKAHPNSIQKPLSPIIFEKMMPDIRYHDHGNLSSKNKLNATEVTPTKKAELLKHTSRTELDSFSSACSQLPDNMKFDCSPGYGEDVCKKRGCCWNRNTTKGSPYCFYPTGYTTYKLVNMTENKHSLHAEYSLTKPSGYPGDFATAVADFTYIAENILQIKIYDPNNKRFEVPIPEVPMLPSPISQLQYRVLLDPVNMGFKVIRLEDNVTIINTDDAAPFILSDKFLQFSTLLPTKNIYGLGEQNTDFKKDMKWHTYTLFNTDQAPWEPSDIPLYGSHPFYLAVERNGKSHGVLLFNSNAMDAVLQPSPAITLRTIGGILHLVVCTGPSPSEVISQYMGYVGRPFMPPYWSLGFHMCKFGYNDLNTTRNVWKTNREAGVPFDVQWNDIDVMEGHKDFTYDPVKYEGLPEFIKEVHSTGMHYITMFDPGISGAEKPGSYPPFDRGLDYNIFVKNTTDQVFFGKVWSNGPTAYPDFTHPNISSYWVEMMADFHKQVPYDGAWIDMNEPSNFVNGQLNGGCAPINLPYLPQKTPSLSFKTVCPEAKHHIGLHYDVHNLYSLSEAITMNFALKEVRGKRPFIISRSSFPGLGRYAGHWSGDISSSWPEMKYTIPAILNFNLFGIPMMGADICGFTQNTTVSLCKRWMQLGSFYPFARNHNDLNAKAQDPVSMGPEVLKASITALRLRYKILPYYYTLFWRAHVFGETVARPLFFEFPSDTRLHSIQDQFLIGPHVMISPILEQGAETTKPLYPGIENWYNLDTGKFIASDEQKEITDADMVAVKGGAIIPCQSPPAKGPVNTANSRSGPLQLIVVPGADGRAKGQLYCDDGDSLNTFEEKKYSQVDFYLKDSVLRNHLRWWGYGVPVVNYVTVYGIPRPKNVQVNNKNVDFNYMENVKRLEIIDLDLSLDKQFTIRWFYKSAFKMDSTSVESALIEEPDLFARPSSIE